MNIKKEQRVCVKFCFNLRKSATETYEMIREAFGDEALSRTQVFEWFSRFKDGRTSLEDDERSGRPSTSTTPDTIAKIQQIIREDSRLTIHSIAKEVRLGYGTCQRILTEELGLHRIAAKFVPRLLTIDQKQRRIDVCTEMKELVSNDETFLSRVITGDESWIYSYDPETKQQSSQWKSPSSPRPKKCRQVKSKMKIMLIVFFDVNGIVHSEFLPQGQTVNSAFYCDVLRRLREDIRRKRPKLWSDNNFLLHHDNAPAHSSFYTQQFLTKNSMTVIPHPAYSPDLAPCDFGLFPHIKMKLKGRRFDTIEETQHESQVALKAVTKSAFQKMFQQWKKRWDRCIQSQGDYFEGDGSHDA